MTVPDEAAALSSTALGPRTRSGLRDGRLRLRVTGLEHGDVVVDLTIPTNLVGIGLNLGARLAAQREGDVAQRILAAIAAGESGTLLEADDPAQGEHLHIWIE